MTVGDESCLKSLGRFVADLTHKTSRMMKVDEDNISISNGAEDWKFFI